MENPSGTELEESAIESQNENKLCFEIFHDSHERDGSSCKCRRGSKPKWRFLEHKGPMFPPEYKPLPSDIKFIYNNSPFKLSPPAEEIATFYAQMLGHDFTKKKLFNENFFNGWRGTMSHHERNVISKLTCCDFTHMHRYFQEQAEKRRNMSKEEKKKLKAQYEAEVNDKGYCTVDGRREKINNFKIEPPGLFRGRGNHPKMGMVKQRVLPEDVTINCSSDSKFPIPPRGHRWKEIRHDNTVTWLSCWTENIFQRPKYILLSCSSNLRISSDCAKYNNARILAKNLSVVRKCYLQDIRSSDERTMQCGVATYLVDHLALRAGNEKGPGEADTVGCCSLRVEHVTPHTTHCVLKFDFHGKDSIRFKRECKVDRIVYSGVKQLIKGKSKNDFLFHSLRPATLNRYLRDLMSGLTAKVFRTCNSSLTFQKELKGNVNKSDPLDRKILAYNRATRAVAVLCNHQKAVPKNYQKSLHKLETRYQEKKRLMQKLAKSYSKAKKKYSRDRSGCNWKCLKKCKRTLQRVEMQLEKMRDKMKERELNKDIALGTSRLHYIDPRITVAWCKRHGVPIEKVFNKTQRCKFSWAMSTPANFVY